MLLALLMTVSAFACDTFALESEVMKKIADDSKSITHYALPGRAKCESLGVCICVEGVDYRVSDYSVSRQRFTTNSDKLIVLKERQAAERQRKEDSAKEMAVLEAKIESETATVSELARYLRLRKR